MITNNHVYCTQIGPLCSWVPRTYRREEGLQRLKNLHFSMILVSSATSQFDSRRSQRQSERWWQGWWLWDQRVLQMQQVTFLVLHKTSSLTLNFLSRVGHFARECPSFTGLPHLGGRREAISARGGGRDYGRGGVRGGGKEYGTSKCLKCNRSILEYYLVLFQVLSLWFRLWKVLKHRYGHFARECREEENR